MAKAKTINLTINGRKTKVRADANQTLLNVLRDLDHYDVKSGCEKGDCGACAVLLDGVAVDSCLTLALTVDGRSITTAAGLGRGGELSALQQAFIELGSIQCGYCTPGLIIAAQSLLQENPDPSDQDIRLGLSGNLCRCTGYTKVFQAVREAAVAMRQQGEGQ
jgi:carbon-monoxide dehydrogenase small subunit